MAKTKVKTKKTSPIVKIIVGVLSAVVGLSVCWGIVLFLTRDSHRHTYTVGFDRDYHYKVCSECGIEKDKKAHSASDSCSSCDFHITEGFIFSDRPGGVEISSWEGVTDTKVFLPETHNGKPVISIASGALAGLTEITHLDIPTSVVKIGSLAIKNCYKLESLVTPFIGSSPIIGANTSENRLDYYLDNVDLKKLTVLGGKLGEYALQGASFLEKVDLKIEINSFPRHVFDGCTKLNTLTYPGSPKRVEAGAFLNCKNLTNFAFEDGIEYIGNSAFLGAEKLAFTTLPNTLTHIDEYAFYACLGLTQVELPNSVRKIERYAFAGCTNLEKFAFPETVERLNDAVCAASLSLTDIYMPKNILAYNNARLDHREDAIVPNVHITGDLEDFIKYSAYFDGYNYKLILDNSLVTSIHIDNVDGLHSYMQNCLSLESISFGSGVTKVSIDKFSEAKNVKTISITDSTTTIEQYTNEPIFFETIKYSGSIKHWLENGNTLFKDIFDVCIHYQDEFPTVVLESLGDSKVLTIPSDVSYVSNYAYYGLNYIEKVVISPSLTYSAAKFPRVDSSYMTRLVEINYPTSFIDYLTADTVITTYADNTTISYAWNTLLERATNLVIGEGVVSIVNSFNHGDSELKNIKLPSTLKTITNSFNNRNILKSVELKEGVTTIEDSFKLAVGLYYLELPSTLTKCVNSFTYLKITAITIPENCLFAGFYGCNYLQKITLSSGVSVDTTTRFLDYCTDVREVVDLTNNFDAATYIANNKSSGDSWMSRLEKVSSVVGGELIHENDTLIYKLQDNVYHVIGLKKNVDKIELDYIEGKSFIIDRLGIVENYSVTEVVLGDGCIGIEGAGFKGLEKLEKVSIGKNVASGLSSSYFYTKALKTITIDEDNAYYTVLQGVVYNKALTSICLVPKRLTGSITIPNTVTSLGTEFAGSDITSINVGNGIESIGFEAFKSCKKLKQVSFGGSVRFIAVNALYLCDALEKVSVANKTNWFIRDDSISVEDMANYEFLIENLTSQDNSKYFYRSTQ